MLDCLPELVEPLGLAEAGRSFRGRIPVNGLSRLAPLLAADSGELEVTLVFRVDERRVAAVSGTVSGHLKLVCQRCLEPVDVPVDLEFRLGIVRSEEQIESLPEGYEPLQTSGEPLALASLIEDEVLLALPPVPVHADGELCETGYRNREPAEERQNPFAVLEKLKSRS